MLEYTRGVMLATTTWAGSAPTWILVGMALVAAWRLTRGGAGSAVSELSESNKVLKAALDEERGKGVVLLARTVALEHKTDVSLVLEPFVKWATDHEAADLERHEVTVASFGVVVDRLNHFDERAEARAKQLADVTAKTSDAQLAVLAKIAEKLTKAA